MTIFIIIFETYLNKALSDNNVFKWRDSNFFSSANRTHALAYPICVLISVIACTLRMSKIRESGRGLKCSGPTVFLSPGDLCLSVPLVGETSVSNCKLDKSIAIYKIF